MPGIAPEDRRRAPRLRGLAPWLALTGAAGAALVAYVTTAEPQVFELDTIPDRFVRVEVPSTVGTTGESDLMMAHDPATDTVEDGLSTFSVDVDTASFTRSVATLAAGQTPPHREVRVEEFLNAVPYDYDLPTGDRPLQVHALAAPSPFDPAVHLLRIGLQAAEVPEAQRKPAHLTFLVDTSCSMASDDKLPLVQESLHLLADQLRDDDTVALVTYAGSSEVVLDPTSAAQRDRIHAAIDALSSSGGTAMAQGVVTAYELALARHQEGHISRVILASDGDANIGPSRHGDLTPMIAAYADRGITLTSLGFGLGGGSYRDTMMEQLANDGDGAYAFVPDLEEAADVLGAQLTGTLQVVARDVKVQVAWNADVVTSYRLVGYDNRRLADEDFADDAVDAGEVGSGHQVSALYEVVLRDGVEGALGEVRLRAKRPGPESPSEAWTVDLGRPLVASIDDASRSYRLAVATAGLAQVLGGQLHPPLLRLRDLEDLARGAANPEERRHRQLLQAFGDARRVLTPRVASR